MQPANHDTFERSTHDVGALDIGVWEHDLARGVIRLDTKGARMFGLPAVVAASGIPWERFRASLHPDDAPEGERRLQENMEHGRLFVWEHRIIPRPGTIRWVMARGRFEQDAGGRMCVRGIVIDTTDLRVEGHSADTGSFLTTLETSETTLVHIADHLTKVWELMQRLEPASAARLNPQLRSLTFELGCCLAAAMSAGASARRNTELH